MPKEVVQIYRKEKKMYLTVKQQVKHLSKDDYKSVKELCHVAKSLANEAIYNVRQYYFAEGKYLKYKENYAMLKNSPNYRTLNSNMAQQILKEVDSLALTSEYRDLNTAFKNFFRDTSVGYPKFKKKHDNHKSYTTYNQKGSVSLVGKYVKLPKVGYVKIRQSQPVLGNIKNAIISQVPSGKYYISFNVEIWVAKYPTTIQEIGLDLGIKDLLITSDEDKYKNPKTLYKYEKQLAKLQRQLAHKQKFSSNWYKIKHKIAILHEKLSNTRKDNLHKISYKLVKDNQLIASETLKVKNMMKNHHLSKSIADVSWYELTRQIAYKI